MKKSESRLTRGQWRVWLQWVIVSGLLDRLPPHYDLEVIEPRDTADAPESFLPLSETPTSAGRPLPGSWPTWRDSGAGSSLVKRQSRQVILAENETARTDPRWLERWAASMIGCRALESQRERSHSSGYSVLAPDVGR